jgi:cytidine deaminase
MEKKEIILSFEVYADLSDLPADDADLLVQARKATALAYAPYSHFHVGAVARMSNGELISGTNQENASFPAGICAERVLLSAASSIYPGESIETLAISYHGKGKKSVSPVAPCGVCRQSLVEYESRYHKPIRLILGGMEGEVYIFEAASKLLPLQFSGEDLV